MDRRRLSVTRSLAELEATAVLPAAFAADGRLAVLVNDPLAGLDPPSTDAALSAVLGASPDQRSPARAEMRLPGGVPPDTRGRIRSTAHAGGRGGAPAPAGSPADGPAGGVGAIPPMPYPRGTPTEVARQPRDSEPRHGSSTAVGRSPTSGMTTRDLTRIANGSAGRPAGARPQPLSHDSPAALSGGDGLSADGNTGAVRADDVGGGTPALGATVIHTTRPAPPGHSSAAGASVSPPSGAVTSAAVAPGSLRDLARMWAPADESPDGIGRPATTLSSAAEPHVHPVAAPPTVPRSNALDGMAGGDHPSGHRHETIDDQGPIAELEIEAEQRLLDLVERGLRDEARRYGVDLDGWSIR